SRADGVDAAATGEKWSALPALPGAWEKLMLARRDAALRAAADAAAAAALVKRMQDADGARRETLLALEMQHGIESPPDLHSQRLALQVKQLRDRFQSAASATANTPGERLLGWCAQPGVVDARDRQRASRVFAAMERTR